MGFGTWEAVLWWTIGELKEEGARGERTMVVRKDVIKWGRYELLSST
jgi:hypothetical protein